MNSHQTPIERLESALERLESMNRSGDVETDGNWSPSQAAWHVAEFLRGSLDGFGFQAPWALRMLVRPFRSFLLSRRSMPRNIPLRGAMKRFVPRPDLGPAEGLDHLRSQLDRVKRGERCTHPSPIFGHLSHEQWLSVHALHAEHHFGRFRIAADDKPTSLRQTA